MLKQPTRKRYEPHHGFLRGLAPSEVYLANLVTQAAGGLLHHRFTLTTVTDGGLLSVALARGLPRVGVTHRCALWSPDVPRRFAPPRSPSRPNRFLV